MARSSAPAVAVRTDPHPPRLAGLCPAHTSRPTTAVHAPAMCRVGMHRRRKVLLATSSDRIRLIGRWICAGAAQMDPAGEPIHVGLADTCPSSTAGRGVVRQSGSDLGQHSVQAIEGQRLRGTGGSRWINAVRGAGVLPISTGANVAGAPRS